MLNPSNELESFQSLQWPSVGAHSPVEQMYIVTSFVTLLHSYIQVTARSINYILFVRTLGVSMLKQSWLKCFSLNTPLFLIRAKLYAGNKDFNFTSQNAKIALQNQKIFSPLLGKLLRSYFVTIIQMLVTIKVGSQSHLTGLL